jgi:putative SOS response-associated peptidase YedK
LPYNSDDPLIASKLSNARAQTLQAKQPFCDMLQKHRCVVIIDGFFVWKDVHNVRTPYRVALKDGQPFAVAGLWDQWEEVSATHGFFKTFALINVASFGLCESYNDRMPAILTEEERLIWLDENKTVDEALKLLKTSSEEEFKIYRVSNLVDNILIDSAKIIRELGTPTPGDTLSLFD